MPDYAANGCAFWTPGRLRCWFENGGRDGAAERLADWLEPSTEEPKSVAEAFWQMVGTNLREGTSARIR